MNFSMTVVRSMIMGLINDFNSFIKKESWLVRLFSASTSFLDQRLERFPDGLVMLGKVGCIQPVFGSGGKFCDFKLSWVILVSKGVWEN